MPIRRRRARGPSRRNLRRARPRARARRARPVRSLGRPGSDLKKFQTEQLWLVPDPGTRALNISFVTKQMPLGYNGTQFAATSMPYTGSSAPMADIAFVTGAMAFRPRLDILTEQSTYVGNYDKYCLFGVGVKVTWKTANRATIVSGTGGITTVCPNPTLLWRVDNDDAVAPASYITMTTTRHKTFRFSATRPTARFFIRPRMVSLMYTSNTLTDIGYAVAKPRQWVDSSYDPEHFGLKWAIIDCLIPQASIGTVPGDVFQWEFTYYVGMKQPVYGLV